MRLEHSNNEGSTRQHVNKKTLCKKLGRNMIPRANVTGAYNEALLTKK